MKATQIALLLLLFGNSSLADELSLDGAELLRRCISSHVQVGDDGLLRLARGVLIEDDGPGAGYSYKPNVEILDDDVRIKKQLLVPQGAASAATLMIAPGGELQVAVNGRKAIVKSQGMVGKYWQSYALDPTLLQDGMNELVISGKGQVWIARDDDFSAGSTERKEHPDRSAKGRHGGKSWDFKRLGKGNNLDGEYYVRLRLDQYQPVATLTSSVLDAANLSTQALAPPLVSVEKIRLLVDAAVPKKTALGVELRSGSTLSPNDNAWSSWQQLDAAAEHEYVLERPAGRFFQFRLQLRTSNLLTSPEIKGVRIEADCKFADDWTRDVAVVGASNGKLARSSIPLVYESFDHPLLVQLRKTHKLDDVVAGTKSELELLERLAAWSATQWEGLGHLGESYPAWNAHEILARHKDGTPVGGFCQQYNIVFLQACAAFGIQGRVVSIGPAKNADTIRSGHETIEVWSQQFGKWIYFDGNTAWYLIDAKTRTPLSLLELRERQLDAFAGRLAPNVEVVNVAKTRFEWKGLGEWPSFAELRLVPRSNFLSEPAPLPLNQGMRGWFWTGYCVWDDNRLPQTPMYSQFVARRDDWEPNIGGVHIVLEPLAEVGRLRVHCETQMPDLAELLVSLDGHDWATTPAIFNWKLHEGHNRMELRAKNRAERVGMPSWIELRSQISE